MTCHFRNLFHGILITGVALALEPVVGQASEVSTQDLESVLAQNRRLQQQLENQQKQIDQLREKLESLQTKGFEQKPALAAVEPVRDIPREIELPAPSAVRVAKEIRISGETGLAFFYSGRDGGFPNAEFRVDDAKLFFEAPIWKNVYFFTGLELTTREAPDEYFHVGELYADMEDVLAAGRDYSLSLRIGRFYLPFGEEYQYRNVMDNPLITHSLADPWGIDEGLQAYGSLGRLQYNLAVQNGGHKTLHDYNPDKSVTLRLGFDPLKSVHLSASAHRTGKLDTVNDVLSEMWFSNGFFRALGPAASTRTFSASLYELDAIWRWKEGHFQASGGEARFDDDNLLADDSRHLDFYSLEVMQQLTGKLYGALRYGAVRAPKGYPLVGLGNAGTYFFNPFAPRTTDLERFSAGLGYQFDPSLIWKLEYSWESGHVVGGTRRGDTDTFASEVGLKF